MKNIGKGFVSICLLWGIFACSNDTENALADAVSDVASDTLITDSLTAEEITLLYKMRTANNRVSAEELLTLTDHVIEALDEESGLKSGNGRKVGSITALVSEKSKSVALKSGGESEIEIPDTLAYVVNFEDSLGFAIISADTRVEQPILGFVDHGTLADSTDNPGMGILLENLEDYVLTSIIEAEEQKDSLWDDILEKLDAESNTKAVVTSISITTSPSTTVSKVGPLMPVEWGQNAPYNNNVGGKCSGDNTASNGKYWAGCVATTTAQMMAYWKHPAKINNHSFNWTEIRKYTGRPNSYPNVGTISIDKAPVNMQSQIATLFHQIGKGVSMDYGCKGSSANKISAMKLLKKHGFKMSTSPIGDMPITFNYKSDEVISFLKKKQPVILDGCEKKTNHKFLGITVYSSYDGCHNWIVDGYLKQKKTITIRVGNQTSVLAFYTEYLHNNWGWNGRENGYYPVGIFNSKLEAIASNTKSYEENNFQYRINVGYVWR